MLRVGGQCRSARPPEGLRSGTAIFDGRMRYDPLSSISSAWETVKAEKGYQGPWCVRDHISCRSRAYIPDRPVDQYLAASRNMEIAFAPVAGTRILVPFRMVIPRPPLGNRHAGSPRSSSPTATPPRVARDELICYSASVRDGAPAPDPESSRFRVWSFGPSRNDGVVARDELILIRRHSGMVRQHQPRNLEIPGLVLRTHPRMTGVVAKHELRGND